METPPPKPPLNVFVVWHPLFVGNEGGEAIADLFYKTLGYQPRNVLSPALGIPVYIRTSRVTGGSVPIPCPIDLGHAEHSVVILLIDKNLALDDEWVGYARTIAAEGLRSPRQHLVLPISFLSRKSSPDIGDTQAIFWTDEPSPERRLVILQLRVMAEICRLLNNMERGDDEDLQLSPERLQLFISHAKFDGEKDALALLEKIKNTPLEAFFDQEHIASGYDFSDELRAQVRRSALVAIQSDAYASRPWCRREILEAKKYERPIVVVHRMSMGEDRSFPYLGNVPTMGWTGDNHYEIIAATVREYLRKTYTKERFQFLKKFDPPQIPEGARSLFRPPELIDGALFRRRSTSTPKDSKEADKAEEAAAVAGVPQEEGPTQLVVYPDPPLGTEEVETLADFFPEITFVTPTTIAATTAGGKRTLKDRTVALSISASSEMEELGFSQTHHLVTAMAKVARHVLVLGGALAYGGDLRPSSAGGFTDELFALVRAYKSAGILPRALVTNYLAWPLYLDLANDADKELELRKVARLDKLPVPGGLIRHFGIDTSRPIPEEFKDAPYVVARCLTETRRTMTEEAHARVVMGGKVSGFSGKYPGILEEVHLALKARKPTYLLGAFGGCTGLVIKAIHGEAVVELDRNYQARNSEPIGNQTAYGRLVDFYERYKDNVDIGDGPVDYDQIVRDLKKAGVEGLNNGLAPSENEELFVSKNLDRIGYLLVKGLTSVLGAG